MKDEQCNEYANKQSTNDQIPILFDWNIYRIYYIFQLIVRLTGFVDELASRKVLLSSSKYNVPSDCFFQRDLLAFCSLNCFFQFGK